MEEEFGEYLTRWIVSSNQAFTAVENPKFRALVEYAARRKLKLPSADTIKRSVTRLASAKVKELRELIAVC